MFGRKAFPLLLVLLFFLMGSWLLQTKKVSVEHELPEKMESGGSVEVPVRIQKGDRGGFAKLELDIPDGLKVEALEKKGSSFTFEDGVAKFIWMAMPEGSEFTVRYRLIADAGTQGKRTISGDLRYIRNNDRKRTALEKKSIIIQKGAVADNDTSAKQEKERIRIRAERDITRVDKGHYRVRLNLKKGKLQGYGKLMERVPKGFEASADEKMDATFTFQDSTAKFVWMQLPEKASFWVQYSLKTSGSEKGEHLIEGRFSYLEGGKNYEQELPSSSFGSEGIAAMAVKSGEKEQDSATGTGEKEKAPVAEQSGTASKEKAGEKAKEKSLTGDVPAPQKKIDYKVQICAGHDPVDESHFARVYDFDRDYDIEHHEGWIKYTTGLFDVYKNARDLRVKFRENYELPGPFVTAYNDGERITVQEALMVTEQEWMQ